MSILYANAALLTLWSQKQQTVDLYDDADVVSCEL